ncbi:protein SPMIP2 isoform X1 [Anser cygnoides]|uniref:protein SPMIP2 isoform X1 n=1 Tax=Anser cygnoides TaxID=8845 RepID=UPI0034D1E846
MGRGTKVQRSWDPPQAGRACSKPPSPTRATRGLALVEARMVFSGPDAIRDHRTRRAEHTHYIGETSPAIEGTSDANYLWRPAPCSRAPPRRSDCPGEIGWGVRELSHFARKNLQSGAQIKRGPIWQAAEDQATHQYQSPWQPAPYVLEQQGRGARARLAWDLGRYKGYLHPRSKWAAVIQAAQSPALPKSKVRKTTVEYWHKTWVPCDTAHVYLCLL